MDNPDDMTSGDRTENEGQERCVKVLELLDTARRLAYDQGFAAGRVEERTAKEAIPEDGELPWWADFEEDSLAKRVSVAEYHLRVAEGMAEDHPTNTRSLCRSLARARKGVTKLFSAPTPTPLALIGLRTKESDAMKKVVCRWNDFAGTGNPDWASLPARVAQLDRATPS